MTKNVKTVLEYLENVQKYNPKSAGEKEAAKREFLDKAHFVYEFKCIDKVLVLFLPIIACVCCVFFNSFIICMLLLFFG